MGSYKGKGSLSLLDETGKTTNGVATQTGTKNGSRHTRDTFEYSTKDAYGVHDSISYSTETMNAATVEHVPQSLVDYQLQALHEELVALPVPERFELLLNKLEHKKDKGS